MKTCGYANTALWLLRAVEGNQATLKHYIDEDEETPCDWCEEPSDVLYELI